MNFEKIEDATASKATECRSWDMSHPEQAIANAGLKELFNQVTQQFTLETKAMNKRLEDMVDVARKRDVMSTDAANRASSSAGHAHESANRASVSARDAHTDKTAAAESNHEALAWSAKAQVFADHSEDTASEALVARTAARSSANRAEDFSETAEDFSETTAEAASAVEANMVAASARRASTIVDAQAETIGELRAEVAEYEEANEGATIHRLEVAVQHRTTTNQRLWVRATTAESDLRHARAENDARGNMIKQLRGVMEDASSNAYSQIAQANHILKN